MAHKKGVGSSDNGRDSNSKRLGVKLFGGEIAKPGNIIVRQRGTKFHPGENVGIGKDHTLFALVDGHVQYRKRRKNRTFVNIVVDDTAIAVAPISRKISLATKAKTDDTPETKTVMPKVDKKESAKKETVSKTVASNNKPTPKATIKKKDTKETAKPHDFKKIEGIGPKIASIINEAGITTFNKLSKTKPEKIREILLAAGNRYKMHDPATWPEQAGMAADGKWDELKTWQDKLKGGKA